MLLQCPTVRASHRMSLHSGAPSPDSLFLRLLVARVQQKRPNKAPGHLALPTTESSYHSTNRANGQYLFRESAIKSVGPHGGGARAFMRLGKIQKGDLEILLTADGFGSRSAPWY